MPVKIACPKCSKKYTLPDSALGKAVKCQECGTAFRTKAPGAAPANPAAAPAKPTQQRPAQQRPAQQRPAQPANPNANEFGLEGGFQKQADIFGAPPQASGGLQNVTDKDPFGDAVDPIVLDSSGAASTPVENPFQSVMTNSSMRGSSARKKAQKKKRGKAGADVSAYGVTRAGMMCVFGAGAAMFFSSFVILIATVVMQVVGGAAPPDGEPGALEAVFGIISLLCLGLFAISIVAMLVGQIMCMFAPQGNERFNSIGSGLLSFLAIIGSVVGTFVLGFAVLSMAGPSGPTQGEAVSLGIGLIVMVLVCGGMFLASTFMFVNFYRKVGQNIKSNALVKVSNQAVIAICVSLALTIGLVAIQAILGAAGLDAETVASIMKIAAHFNSLFSLVVFAVMLRMVWTGILSLKS